MRFIKYRSGWYNDSYRHRLAARGVRTSFATVDIPNLPPDFEESPIERVISKFDEKTGEKTNERVTIQTPVSSSRKIAEETALQTFAKQYGTADFNQAVERIRSGVIDMGAIKNFQNSEDYKSDAYRQEVLKDAVYQGASNKVSRGEPINVFALGGIGLSQARLKNLSEQMRISQKGTLGAVIPGRGFYKEKAGQVAGGIKGAASWLGETAERITSVGLKNIRSADGQPSKSAFDQMEEARAQRKMTEAANFGAFNPLRIAGVDVDAIEAKERIKDRAYQDSIRARQEVDSIYNNRNTLASISMSAFDKGNSSFKAGNRESLIDAITDLEAEHSKIKDRWNVVQDTRKLVLSPENRDQTINRASKQSGPFPSVIFSGGGADQISDETKKIAEVERKLKNSSNMLSARIGILRNKLKRMNSVIPVDATAPQKVNTVGGGGDGGGFLSINAIGNVLDENQGKFKNPIFENKEEVKQNENKTNNMEI